MPRNYYGSRGPSRARMEFLRSVNYRLQSKKNKDTYSVLKGTLQQYPASTNIMVHVGKDQRRRRPCHLQF